MKKLPLILTITLASIFTLIGCGEQKAVKAEELLHHRFMLIKENGTDVSSDTDAYIEFGENMNINGKMCNRFFGKASLEDGKLSSSGLASTRMLCSEAQLNQLDNVIGQMFKDGANVTLSDGILTLKTNDYELVYIMKDLVN